MSHPVEASTVTRLMRAAIKSGDDYITIEECVVLPIGASETMIAEAVTTGLRIFKAQQTAIEEQISGLRLAPAVAQAAKSATPNQRSFIERLASLIGHSSMSAADACGYSVDGLTVDQASHIIEALQQGRISSTNSQGNNALVDAPPVSVEQAVPAAKEAHPITTQQIRAVTACCQTKNVTIQQAITDHLASTAALEDLTQHQAGRLITALNEREPAAYKATNVRRHR